MNPSPSFSASTSFSACPLNNSSSAASSAATHQLLQAGVKSEERVFNSELSVRLQNGVGVSGRHSERQAPRVAPHQRLQQRRVGVSQRLIRTADGGDVRGAESRPAILAESQPALKFRVNRPKTKHLSRPGPPGVCVGCLFFFTVVINVFFKNKIHLSSSSFSLLICAHVSDCHGSLLLSNWRVVIPDIL